MQPVVAIIYLCHGNLKYLPEVVKALAAQTYPKDKITVYMVPNGSPDGIADAIRNDVLPRSGIDLPRVVLLDDGINHGFAGGNNIGIRKALDENHDYVFLHNGDLKLAPEAIAASVERAESDEKIGSVQSLVFYWHQPDVINVSGGVFHLAGYGFARDNLVKIDNGSCHGSDSSEWHGDGAPDSAERARRASTDGVGAVTGPATRELIDLRPDGEEIAYASGAAVMYRASALRRVGLLEEGFFMYHEDLELGLRLRIAGYKNVLSTKSQALHDYSFSRNPKKFAWTELYRWIVVLAYYKIPTLILIMPILLTVEAATWFLALKGGWLKAKIWQYLEFVKPRTWKLLTQMRRRAKRLRVVPDREILRFVSGKIEAQETDSFIMRAIANPGISFLLGLIRLIVVW